MEYIEATKKAELRLNNNKKDAAQSRLNKENTNKILQKQALPFIPHPIEFALKNIKGISNQMHNGI